MRAKSLSAAQGHAGLEGTDVDEHGGSPGVVAHQLCQAMGGVLNVPGCSKRPTDLAKRMGVSRVMISRLVSALKKPEPVETLTVVPGPETLRSIVRGASGAGVAQGVIDSADSAIDAFDRLIRDQYGTRAALDAALSVQNTGSLEKFEQSSRYQVFKGMSRVLGAQAETWITSMMLTPSAENPDSLDLTTLHGTVGVRRLRPDRPIHFTHGTPPKIAEKRETPQRIAVDLAPFYQHKPAPIESRMHNGQLVHTFAPDATGKDAKYDMLAAVHTPGGSGRFASEGRTMRGISVIPDIPVVTLVADLLLHGDVFEGIEPRVLVYNMMARGGADPEDPSRDIDRVPFVGSIDMIGSGLDSLTLPEVPGYSGMVGHIHEQHGFRSEEYRAYRLRIQYPVIGFQYVIVFDVAPKP